MSHTSRRSMLKTTGGALTAFPMCGFAAIDELGGNESTSGHGLPCPDLNFEQIVTSILDAPKDGAIEVVAKHLRQEKPVNMLYSAVFHAAVRGEKRFGVSGYPHAMLAVRSATQLEKLVPHSKQQYPLFCTLDTLKNEQGYVTSRTALQPLKEELVPGSAKESAKRFDAAMASWEPELADPAIVGLFRNGGRNAVLEPLYRYATRKNTGIGHFPILIAQATQSLDAFGWGCAEPVLRQMGQAMALPPREHDLNIFETTSKLIAEHDPVLRSVKVDDGATIELLTMARQSTSESIVREVIRMLKSGVSARSCWDAVVLCGAEIVLRDAAGDAHSMARLSPSAIGIHQVDTANALRFIFDQSKDNTTKALCLCQAVAWMPYFVRSARFTSSKPSIRINQLEPSTSTPATLDDIFVATGTDNLEAGRRVLAWIKAGKPIDELKTKSCELAVRKFSDPHEFKFPVALFEEATLAHPRWQPAMLAAQAMYARLEAEPNWDMLKEVQEAVAKVSL